MRSSSGWSTSSSANRPRVEGDRAHLRRPADDGHLGRADLVGVAPRRELDPRGLHVVRGSPRDALLKEGVAAALLPGREDDARVHALGPALERRRPSLERAHDAVLDREVVADDVELGDRGRALGRREDHAIGVGHAQIAPTGVDGRCLRVGHARGVLHNNGRRIAAAWGDPSSGLPAARSRAGTLGSGVNPTLRAGPSARSAIPFVRGDEFGRHPPSNPLYVRALEPERRCSPWAPTAAHGGLP